MALMRRVLDERASHMTPPKARFLDELEDHMSPEAAEETLRTIVSWGRFAEIFAYDDDIGQCSVWENPSAITTSVSWPAGVRATQVTQTLCRRIFPV